MSRLVQPLLLFAPESRRLYGEPPHHKCLLFKIVIQKEGESRQNGQQRLRLNESFYFRIEDGALLYYSLTSNDSFLIRNLTCLGKILLYQHTPVVSNSPQLIIGGALVRYDEIQTPIVRKRQTRSSFKRPTPIKLLNVMSKPQILIRPVANRPDFIILHHKVAIRTKKVVGHQECIMRRQENLAL